MSNVSYYAIKTIIIYKLKEFFYEFQHTILSPLISMFAFVLIISILQGQYNFLINNMDYLNFIIPGIIIMIVMQTSYNNISENLITMKQIGSFNDYLISPISRIEILISLLLSSILMSLFLAFFSIIIFMFIIEMNSFNWILIIYYLVITSLFFSCIGAIVGFLYFTWDIQQSVSNFFIIPLSLLSGTFFSINIINPKWDFLFNLNPIYQIIYKFRKSFYNDFEVNILSDLYILFICLFIFFISIIIFKKGYRVIN